MANISTAVQGKMDKLDRKLSSNDETTFTGTLQKDVSALKEDVMELGRHVTQNKDVAIKELKDTFGKQYDKARAYGIEELKKTEAMIQEKPAKAVAIAFAAGLIASFLFGRR